MISLRLFGPVDVQAEGVRIDLASTKLSCLLAILASAGAKPVPRETLADMLWGSHFDEQARQNFRQALSRLRKLLDSPVIIADDQMVRLDADLFTSDLQRFEILCRDKTESALAEAVEIGREEFLAGVTLRESGFANWLAAERQRIRAMVRNANVQLAVIRLDAGEAAAALACAETVLQTDDFDEEGHRLRLRCLSALGRKAEALKAHQAFADRLKAELGAAPETVTLNVIAELKSATFENGGHREPARPSIAVMPFTSPGSDEEQSYFADGMVEELITALSSLHWLTVISRSATFAVRHTGMDARQAGQIFGVRYVLEGSVRRAGAAVRITGQLVETASGTSIWAGRFDGTLENIFELQDQVTAKVVGALQPRLEQAEIERSRRKPTGSLDAYDYYLRGLAEVHRWSREANGEALRYFHRAIELDRHFAAAYGMAARCLSQRKTSGRVEDEGRERAEAEVLAGLAIEFGHDDPVALASAGIALAFVVGRVREGGDIIERALALNPGLALAWMYSGWVKTWNGEPDEAVARVNRAISLSPHDPYIASMRRAIALAHFIAGRYAEAIESAEAVATAPQNAGVGNASIAASASMLGREDQAREAMVRLRLSDPKLRMASLRWRFPIVKDEDFARFADALRQAGLPE